MRNSPKNEIDFHKYEKYINLGVSLTQKDIFGRNPLFYLFITEKNEIKKKSRSKFFSFLFIRWL